MKRLTLISFILLGALLLSACSAAGNTASWPGLAADQQKAYLADGAFVYAVRLSDGTKAWQYPDKSGSQVFYSNPVITSDGQVLIGSAGRDKGLISLDAATGQPKWAAPFVAGDQWVAPPLVVGDTVYAANDDGSLYALKLATGQKLWSLPLGQLLWAAPVTDGNLIFVTSLDHFIYAVDPQTHKVAWKTDLGGSAPDSPSLSADGSTLFVGSFAKKVFALDTATGAVRWQADMQDWIWGTPALGGDSVYAADISGNVYSLGAPNGKDPWPNVQPDGPISGGPLALPGGVLVATESGTIFTFDGTGAAGWKTAIGGKIYTTPIASGNLILVAPMGAPYLLYAVNSKDGSLLPWHFDGK